MTVDATKSSSVFFANLMQTHAQIEGRLKELERASDLLRDPASCAGALETMTRVLDFFSTAGLRHHDDEEHTLFPRLRPLPAFAQMLGAFDAQHKMNDDEHAMLAAQVQSFAPGGQTALRNLAYRFAEMHRAHMLAEERVLFPLAERTLSGELLAEMEAERAQRELVNRR